MDAISKKPKPTWVQEVRRYQRPTIRKSTWQILNSFVPFFACLLSSYLLLDVSYWLSLPLSILAAGFMMRIFIIQHDCGHGSFFKSQRANDALGIVCSVLTWTPYEFWRTSHAYHHAHNGDLNHRGVGDVLVMTVNEYRAAPPRKRFEYRLYRNPILMFLVAPPLLFLVINRSPFALRKARNDRGRRSIIRTDIALVIALSVIFLLIGVGDFIKIYLPTTLVATSLGVWMFYVQHQFEDAYWSQAPDWDYTASALKGSSYYKLPKVFQWFTGNIGFHHIHHLSPLIPNYELEHCHEENPAFQQVVTLTVRDSLRIVWEGLALWDEDTQRLISFREYNRREKAAQQQAASVEPVQVAS